MATFESETILQNEPDENGSGIENRNEKRDEKTHTTYFQDYPPYLADKLHNIRNDFVDGGLVIHSDGKRKRVLVFMSVVGAGSPKLLEQFKMAKSLMKESGLITPGRIDIQIPYFENENQSGQVNALIQILKYIYTGTLQVSTKSILNVATLASYFDMSSILDRLPECAKTLQLNNFPFDSLVQKGLNLPNAIVVGLKHFVNSGFSNCDFELQAHRTTQLTSRERTVKRKSQTVQVEPDLKKSKSEKISSVPARRDSMCQTDLPLDFLMTLNGLPAEPSSSLNELKLAEVKTAVLDQQSEPPQEPVTPKPRGKGKARRGKPKSKPL